MLLKKRFHLLLFIIFANIALIGNLHAYELGPTEPGKWGNPTIGTSGGLVTWSLMPTDVKINLANGDNYTNTSLYDFMPVGFKTELEKAFDAWSAVANISFIEVADGGGDFPSEDTGDIRIGGHSFDGANGILAHGYFPPVNGLYAAGDIHFDIDENWVFGFDGPGIDIFQTAAHEIGHAIGLDHTSDPNALMNPIYSEAFSGPQADDIAGAQFLYGEPIASKQTAVPEPSTYLFLGTCLFIAVIAGKRKLSMAYTKNN